jgi:hypothetical protein
MEDSDIFGITTGLRSAHCLCQKNYTDGVLAAVPFRIRIGMEQAD